MNQWWSIGEKREYKGRVREEVGSGERNKTEKHVSEGEIRRDWREIIESGTEKCREIEKE